MLSAAAATEIAPSMHLASLGGVGVEAFHKVAVMTDSRQPAALRPVGSTDGWDVHGSSQVRAPHATSASEEPGRVLSADAAKAAPILQEAAAAAAPITIQVMCNAQGGVHTAPSAEVAALTPALSGDVKSRSWGCAAVGSRMVKFFRDKDNQRVMLLGSAAGSVGGVMAGMTGMGEWLMS
jgi:hypothetical protein